MDPKKSLFIRVNGDSLKLETTEDEKKFRETQFSDESSVFKRSVTCTACGKNIKEKIVNKDIHVHPVLEVLWCKKCEEFYSDGEFSADEDGSDKYCRWCAQGGSLYCCSYCSVAFCERCVRRNVPRKMLKDVEDDDWRCFVCVSKPLWPLRAICDAAKRYVDSGPKSRKSARKVKAQSEEDTTESEVSSKRSKRKRKNDTGSTEEEKYNADSEDTTSLETNKNKRKYAASSSEDTSSERRSRRRKIDDEDTKAKPHPDEKKKEKFEDIVADAITESAALRKLLTKKETTWKKNYFGTDVTKLNKTVEQSEEEFSKFFADIKTSINLIEKSFTDKFTVLKNELSKGKEKKELSPIKEDQSTIDEPETEPIDEPESETTIEPEIENKDEDMADVSIVSETVAKQTPEKSPRKLSTISMNGTDDMSLTIFDDDNTTDANDKPTDGDKSSKSISDSLAVNVSSIIDSLNSDDENELRNQTTVKEIDPLEIESSKPEDIAENDAQVIISDKEDDDEVIITEPTDPNETILEENKAKMSLLQSSSDNATTDNEKTNKLSSGSELSGVSVLHSDQDDVNKTKGVEHLIDKNLTMRAIEAT